MWINLYRSAVSIDVQEEDTFETFISFEDDDCEASSIGVQQEQIFETLNTFEDNDCEASEVVIFE